MVIQTAGVVMNAVHYENTIKAESVSYTGWGNAVGEITDDGITAATTPQARDSKQTQVTDSITLYDLLAEGEANAGKINVLENDSYEGELKLEHDTFDNLLNLLFKSRYGSSRKITPREMFEQLIQDYRDRLYSYLSKSDYDYTALAGLSPTENWQVNVTMKDFYQESEQTEFYSSGTVVTADGRQIEFDVAAVMSRSFTEYADVRIDYSAANLIDPLVIQLGEGMAQVTNQTFLFDIDADGELDNISILAELCGYLALDKNEDGIINDGSELFGTETGNGFAELAVFDMDNNGWIDENDEIFNRLRIWTKDAEGNDKLMALGVAGVGAIYLGNVASAFTLKNTENNEVQGVVRTSGIYLKENGSAGILQQIDMAAQA